MTHPSNRNRYIHFNLINNIYSFKNHNFFIIFIRLLQSVSQAMGLMAEVTLRAIDVNRLPALVLITRNRSNTEILSVINGNFSCQKCI